MKKILILFICIMLAVSFTGCGKDNGKNSSPETNNEVVDNDGIDEDMDEFQAKADEFNNTTDPVRKEELRQEFEAMLSQIEGIEVTE